MNILNPNFKVNNDNALSVLIESFMISKASSLAQCIVFIVVQKHSRLEFDFISYVREESYIDDLEALTVSELNTIFSSIPNIKGHERLNLSNFGEYMLNVLNNIVLQDLDKHGPELASRIDQCHDIDSLIREEIQIQREYRSRTVYTEINVD